MSPVAVAATGIACRRSTIAIAAVGSLLAYLPVRLALARRSLPGTPRIGTPVVVGHGATVLDAINFMKTLQRGIAA